MNIERLYKLIYMDCDYSVDCGVFSDFAKIEKEIKNLVQTTWQNQKIMPNITRQTMFHYTLDNNKGEFLVNEYILNQSIGHL